MSVATRDTERRGSAQVTTLPRPRLRSGEEAVAASLDLFSMSGASATDERYNLGRYWRNARTHASHDPVDWKHHHVGNYLLRGVLPPNHGQL
jgi:alkylation response protein AidB-like acyl-CoA dehydrogenase